MTTRVRAGDIDSPADGSNRDKVLYDFDRAWRSGPAPRIDEFLARLPGHAWPVGSPSRRSLLEELITIDLDYRWRNGSRATNGRGPLRLEAYVIRYPELGPGDGFSPDLIGEEYWVRHRWGDRPGHAEYASRFPRQQPQLETVLAQIDAELAEELSAEAEPRRSVTGPFESDASFAGLPGHAAPPAASNTPLSTAAELSDALARHGLLSAIQRKDENDELNRFADARALAGELIRRDWLTPFQANQLLQGRGAALLLGPYVLLERLGRGGAGQVFKAKHQHMGRLVALKLIRQELLSDAEAVARFKREIKVISQLRHPNVVLAHDAGPLGSNYFLAMEYVEGVDLSRLVKEMGHLPPALACDYVRQTALGLQHIHERGLVHRDIKPSNLLLVRGDGAASDGMASASTHQVKILDLGLARVSQSAVLEGLGVMTAVGTLLVGTLDYMAPEQARDFHQADVRADIYSLGCTLYFLLTGQPPFSEGTIAQKLMLHQNAEPWPVEQVRADLPAWLPGVVQRMMAKAPEDRFQTPAELAAVLTMSLDPPASIAVALPVGMMEVGPAPHPLAALVTKPFHRMGLPRRRLLAVGGAVLGTLLLGGLALTLLGPTRDHIPPTRQVPAPVPVVAQTTRTTVPDGNDPVSPFEALAARGVSANQRPAKEVRDLVAILGEGVYRFAVTADGRTVVLGTTKGPARLYNLLDGKETTIFGLPDCTSTQVFTIAPNGQWGALGGDGAVDLWNRESATRLGRISLFPAGRKVASVAISPDSQMMAFGDGNRNNPSDPGELNVFRSGQPQAVQLDSGCKGGIFALAFAARAKVAGEPADVEMLLAAGGGDGSIALLNLGQGGKKCAQAPTGHAGAIRGLSFSPDGRLASAGDDGMIQVWDPETGIQARSLESRGSKFLSVAWSPDGKRLAGCTNTGSVSVWQMPRAQLSSNWELPAPVTQVAFSPDGKFLLTCNGNGTVYVFRLATSAKQ